MSSSSQNFTPRELQGAIERVLRAAGYTVESNKKIHGAEFDVVATKRGVIAPEVLYIECTIEYIGVEKYGKDLSKLVLVKDNPGAYGIIISSSGFAAPTKERSVQSGVHLWTYEEFRQRFIATAAYERKVLGPSELEAERIAPPERGMPKPLWQDLADLESVYQNPQIIVRMRDSQNNVSTSALEWFDTWLNSPNRSWVSLIGDYGSGKTALSKMLLLRWMRAWREEKSTYLPIRIELKEFATKFDFEGLLIHFWRTNDLDEMPIRTLEMMVAEGRVVFILDGYDEMAQNLNLMDRRNCLVALAKALSGEATGIITSRPNYFTEAEELNIVELLYRKGANFHRLDRELVLQESEIDSFLAQYYYDRNESRLLDLDPQQVKSLIEKRLSATPDLLSNVHKILDDIYDFEMQDHPTTNSKQALANKPVIVTYLLEVAENLQKVTLSEYQPLDEWGIFQLILDKLVQRDQGRTSGIVTPGERRLFLQRLAYKLSYERKTSATRADMLDLVHSMFGLQIRRLGEYEIGAQEEIYFADLRSSASLTSDREAETWYFSHNSLREFLVIELVTETLRGISNLAPNEQRRVLERSGTIPMSQGVVRFLSAALLRFDDIKERLAEHMAIEPDAIIPFIFPAIAATYKGRVDTYFREINPSKRIAGAIISELKLEGETLNGWKFEDIIFDRSVFQRSRFIDCIFESCGFFDTSFLASEFQGCMFIRCELSSVIIDSSRFPHSTIQQEDIQTITSGKIPLYADNGRALLRHLGASIAEGRHLNTFQFYPQWPDFLKVLTQISDDLAWKQELGLVKKGGVQNTRWTQKLVDTLVNAGICERSGHNEPLVRLDSSHQKLVAQMMKGIVPSQVAKLFR